jgi:hypothetical protein
MNAKKALLALAIVFLGFWLFQDPSGLADAAKGGGSSAWAMLVQLFNAVINFFDAL